MAIKTIETLIMREENNEIMALYGSGNYVLSLPYKRWGFTIWHSWPPERMNNHLKNFRIFSPTLEQTFSKPSNAGRKPGFKQSKRTQVLPTLVVDHHENAGSTSADSQNANDNQSTSNDRHENVGSTSADSQNANDNQSTSNEALSFPDTLTKDVKEFELHLRSNLPKSVSRCQGKCGKPILPTDVMLVKSYRSTSWTDKTTRKEKTCYGPLHIHFKEECLKIFDSDSFYAPGEQFPFQKIKIDKATKEKLKDSEILYMQKWA